MLSSASKKTYEMGFINRAIRFSSLQASHQCVTHKKQKPTGDNVARISANKLAELLVSSSPMRRRRIVHDQKHPSPHIVALYRNAYEPIAEYLVNGRNAQSIMAAAKALRDNRQGTEWAIDDRWNTADALEKFAEIGEGLPISNDEIYSRGEANPSKLNISGVDVSVRPDFLINFTKRGVKHTGAIKLHFIKNAESALTRAGSEYVSTLLHKWLENNGPDGTKPSHAHCLTIDVFRQTTMQAPKSNARRIQDISAACEEIAARWPQL